jgi:hypothetical protein
MNDPDAVAHPTPHVSVNIDVVALYRGGASVRAIVGMHPSLSYRRVREILASAGELRDNHGWRSLTGKTR